MQVYLTQVNDLLMTWCNLSGKLSFRGRLIRSNASIQGRGVISFEFFQWFSWSCAPTGFHDEWGGCALTPGMDTLWCPWAVGSLLNPLTCLHVRYSPDFPEFPLFVCDVTIDLKVFSYQIPWYKVNRTSDSKLISKFKVNYLHSVLSS